MVFIIIFSDQTVIRQPMFYNSFAPTREVTDRRIIKLKAELLELGTYMVANVNEENRPALIRIHANVTGQPFALEKSTFQNHK